jgi:hypothetical protein
MAFFGSWDLSEFDSTIAEFNAPVCRLAVQQESEAGTKVGVKWRHGVKGRPIAAFAAIITVLAVSGCGQSSKTYDISPIFPLSSDKCTKYHGKSEGSGFDSHCWVSKAECEQASSDWKQSMQNGGVGDAILFSCD